MTVKRIIMQYLDFGVPTGEEQTKESIKLHLFLKQFDIDCQKFRYDSITQIGLNLFAIESILGKYTYCFRPKWTQYLKFYFYFYCHKILGVIKAII